jgi:hypothetical protein
MGDFLKEFLKESSDKVNSSTVLATVLTLIISALAVPLMLEAMWLIYYHAYVLKKGLDRDVVTLILGLMGGGGVGCGLGYGVSRFRSGGGPPSGWRPPAKPAEGD